MKNETETNTLKITVNGHDHEWILGTITTGRNRYCFHCAPVAKKLFVHRDGGIVCIALDRGWRIRPSRKTEREVLAALTKEFGL